jgi:aryl-alcohol dehydrogenase-like predicted oxidoreductase
MGLSAFYGTPDPDSTRLAVLDRAYALGETFWDSADIYGDSEDLVGKWFAANPGKRDEIFLATKFANKVVNTGGRDRAGLSIRVPSMRRRRVRRV